MVLMTGLVMTKAVALTVIVMGIVMRMAIQVEAIATHSTAIRQRACTR